MPKKIRDELEFLTRGLRTTGLEYVKNRKKRGGGVFIPLAVAAVQTGVTELITWWLTEEQRKEAERHEAFIKAHDDKYIARETKKLEAEAYADYGRSYAEQTQQFQSQYGSQYRNQLANAVMRAKQEEQEFLEQQDAQRRMIDRAMTQRQLQETEAEQMQENLRGQQLSNSARQRAMNDARTAQQRQAATLQGQMASRQVASSQVYTAELQQRLRQTQAEAQARQVQTQTQRRRVAAPVSTAQKLRTRR
jgi:hypothetical protein